MEVQKAEGAALLVGCVDPEASVDPLPQRAKPALVPVAPSASPAAKVVLRAVDTGEVAADTVAVVVTGTARWEVSLEQCDLN